MAFFNLSSHIDVICPLKRGGKSLYHIYFQDEKEFMHCCDILFQREKSIHIAWEKDTQWGNKMIVLVDEIDVQTWVHCFVVLYITFRLKKKIKTIAQNIYYYEDPEEINKIYESTINVLSEKYYKSKIFPEHETLYTTLFSLIQYHLQDLQHVHYDALVLFGLKRIDTELTKAVGFGIDEIKREEMFEDFIIHAREKIFQQTIPNTELHIKEKDGMLLYYTNEVYFSKTNSPYDPRLSSNHLMDIAIEDTYLSSIFALAPEKIYVYTERPIEGKVNTLYKIYQENMTLLELGKFPLVNK